MRDYLIDLYRHRDLLFWLTAKEVKVRYKSPVLGWLWSLMVPLSMSLVFFVIFTYVAPLPKTDIPFFLFLIVAIFPWMFFAGSVSRAAMSVLDSGGLIKKHPFPRALVPIAVVMSYFVNFALGLIVVIGFVVAMGVPLTPWVGLLPAALGLELMLTTGMALLVSGLQVHYRDIKYVVEISLMLGFYLTPIFYPVHLLSQLPRLAQLVYCMNPMVHIVELFRLSLLGTVSGPTVLPPVAVLGVATAATVGIFVVGVSLFRRYESTFADWVLG